jgi:mannosyl-oligosaccharide alpha-1,2-mannosidase
VVESLFILHQVTGDPQYREWGLQIFQSINANCRARWGYASLHDVTVVRAGRETPKKASAGANGQKGFGGMGGVGVSEVGDVDDADRNADDRMESFFMAETLKYLYLLLDPDHTISLDEYVFNTEAHPLRLRRRSA